MNNLELVKQTILPIVEKHNLKLVDVVWEKMGHQKVLNISLANQMGTLDLETASLLTQPISDALDQIEALNFEYILDIGSPGAERVLHSLDDMINSINQYVRATLNDGNSIEGTLLDVTDEHVIISHFIKGRPKKSTLRFKELKQIQLAVKV